MHFIRPNFDACNDAESTTGSSDNTQPRTDEVTLVRERARWVTRRYAIAGVMAATIATLALGDQP